MPKKKRQPGEVSTRTRFEVFKRDLFTCQYCGRKPPDVILHCDHVIAVANGGKSTQDNLVTSCASCNLGKSSVPLNQAAPGLSVRVEQMHEARAQLRAYKRLLQEVEEELEADVSLVNEVFGIHFPGFCLSEPFKSGTVRQFLKHLPVQFVTDAMRKACGKFPGYKDAASKYFCGICWSEIKTPGGKPWRK